MEIQSRRMFPVLLLIPLLLSSAACAPLIRLATSSRCDWDSARFYRTEIGDPVRISRNTWFLPVLTIYTGSTTVYRDAPPPISSAKALRSVEGRVLDSGTIQVWFKECLVTHDAGKKVNFGIWLSGLARGRHRVEYLNPDGSTVFIREIEIQPAKTD